MTVADFWFALLIAGWLYLTIKFPGAIREVWGNTFDVLYATAFYVFVTIGTLHSVYRYYYA